MPETRPGKGDNWRPHFATASLVMRDVSLPESSKARTFHHFIPSCPMLTFAVGITAMCGENRKHDLKDSCGRLLLFPALLNEELTRE
ncbi:unnamed protein product, partial [Nesidiocoris tenuis]